jgi:hypothetical protein
MTRHVYRVAASFELPLEELIEYLDDPALHADVADVEVTRRSNKLLIKAVSADDSLSKYTPTAQLKASIVEKRIYTDEPPEDVPRWEQDDADRESELVEYARFKGDRESVLQNTALQYPMFELLCELALQDEAGELTAIIGEDDDLEAVKILEGQRCSASVKVVEDPTPEDEAAEGGVDWRGNQFIGN